MQHDLFRLAEVSASKLSLPCIQRPPTSTPRGPEVECYSHRFSTGLAGNGYHGNRCIVAKSLIPHDARSPPKNGSYELSKWVMFAL